MEEKFLGVVPGAVNARPISAMAQFGKKPPAIPAVK